MTRRASLFALAGLALLLVAVLADVAQGAGNLSLRTVIDGLLHDRASLDGALVRDVRLPRAVAGVIAGAALAAAAILLIAVTRNPLAEPATLGLTAGGTLAVTVTSAYASVAPGVSTIAVAFVGVVFGAVLIGAIATVAGAAPVRIVLAGMAISLALGAVSAAIQLLRETETSGLFLWGAGSLLQSGWEQVRAGALVGAVVLVGCFALGRALDVAALGESTARALGLRNGVTRLLSVVAAVLLTAVAVGVAGPIAFVGVLSAAIARAARPRGHAAQLLIAVPWGAAIVVSADVVARIVFSVDDETPAGIICALIGAPVLIAAAKRLRDTGAPMIDAAASSARWRPRGVAVAVALTIVAAFASLCIGELSASPREIVRSIFGTGEGLGDLVLELRAPRLCVALLAGACLAASGVVLQASVRNPFAGPELVGVTGGASVAAFIVLLTLPAAPRGVLPFAAFAGGVAAMMLVLVLAGSGRGSPQRLALVGLAVSAACLAVTTLLVLNAEPAASVAVTWLAGSTYAQSWSELRLLVIPALVLIPLAALAVRRLDVLMLDDELGAALGLRVGAARATLLTVGAALAASAVAVTGAIAFVGLLAPHVARLIAGGNHRRLLPVAMLVGATLLATADALGRILFAPTEIPSGLVVAMIGAPYLSWMMWRGRLAAA
ncbi:MAG: iron ABC transporter permease [Solirubrobacteraceae bacterium]|nr:iron ABC transporter permease [Solirubrobacteraceae bacterium]